MLNWVIAGLAALGVYFLGKKILGWAWDEPLPPPAPPPSIESAIGTSAKTVRLLLNKGSGQVELERYRPDLGSSFPFFAFLNPLGYADVDDTFGLHPDTSYIYRVRRTKPPSDWSDPPGKGKEARTLAVALDKGQLFDTSSGWEGFCLVQRFEANLLSRSGELVSITIRASPAGLSIDRIYISQADPTGDPYDSVEYRQTMQDLLFKPPLVISPSEAYLPKTLPAILYTLDHTKPLLIVIDFSAAPVSGIMYKEVPPREAVAYYKRQGPLQPGEVPEAWKTDRDSFTRYPVDTTKGGIYLIERIDVG